MTDPLPTPQPPPRPEPAPASNGWVGWIGFALGIFVAAAVAIGIVLWLAKSTPPAPKPPLILPATISGHAGYHITIEADTTAKKVKWKLLSKPPGTPTDAPSLWDESPLKTGFCTPTPGTYKLQAIAVVSDEAYEEETNVYIDVEPPGPGPGPTPPGPTPPGPTPIPASQLRVLMTYDSDIKVTPGQLAVLKSTATQKLVPTGNWRIFSTKTTFGDELPVWKSVYEKRKNPVGIVLFNGTDGSIVYEGPLPDGMTEAAALIKKYGG